MKKVITTLLLLCGCVYAQASPFADSDVCPTLPSLSSTAQATSFSDGDAQAGEKLFGQYKCNSCHIDKMGGDGSAIFTRPDRTVTSPEELIKQMTLCSGIIGKTLTIQEQQHLGAYLNQRYYKLK
ncbi:MAG: cytochrome c [Gallionella sp.]|nr:cytochrome c [Gallionella sp.]